MAVQSIDSNPVAEGQQRISGGPRASASDFSALGEREGAGFLSATESLVRGLSATGADANYHRDLANSQWMDNAAISTTDSYNKFFDENKDKAGKGLPDIFHASYEKYTGEALANADKQGLTEEQRNQFQSHLAHIGAGFLEKSIAMEGVGRANTSVNLLNDSLAKTNDMVNTVPGLWRPMQAAMQSQLDGLRAANYLTPNAIESYNRDIANVAVTAARSVLGTDPDHAEEIMREAQGVEPNLRFAVANEIKSARNSRDVLGQYAQDQLLDSNLSSIVHTGVPAKDFNRDAYLAAQPERERGVAARELDAKLYLANAGFKVTSQMEGAPPTKLQQVLDAAKPTPGASDFALKSKIYEVAQEQARRNFSEFTQDPFGYSMKNPVVADMQRRAQQLAQNPMMSAPDAAVKANQAMIQASVDWQIKEAGIPANDVVVAPLQALQQNAQMLNTLKGDVLEKQIAGLQLAYGENFPTLVSNMLSLPPSQRANGDVAAIIQAMQHPSGSSVANNLQIDPKTYDYTDAQKTLFGETMASNTVLNQMKHSMVAGGADMSNDIEGLNNAVKKDAYGLLAHGQATTVKDAVNKAVGRIVSQNYDFSDMNGQTIQVPRVAVPANPATGRRAVAYTPEEIDLIKFGAREWLSKFEPAGVDKASFGLGPGTPEMDMEKMRLMIRQNGFFNLNADGRSYTLMLPSADAYGGYAPVTRNRNPVTIPVAPLVGLGIDGKRNAIYTQPFPLYQD